MTRRQNASWASVVAAGLMLTVSACGGSGTAASPKADPSVMLGAQLTGMVSEFNKMGTVEWHGQLLTKNPDKGGERIFSIDGRYSPSTGYSELSMDSALDGNVQQVDYLVVNDRAYFNSDNWGPGSADCWVDITGDAARTWGLPEQLDPSWPLTTSRALALDGDDVNVAVALKPVLAGLPRGLFASTPTVPYDTEAEAVISPHGHLIEVGVDVQSMWKDAPKSSMADFDTRSAGWWAMTMKQSPNGANIEQPAHVFDPLVTPPSQCKR